jgi:membrane protease YdiL (CAAX protease family)
VLTHALLPAVLEEGLFRFVPLKVLSPISRKIAVLLSAALFAIVHGSVYKIPYAFAAGVIFAMLDIYFASLLPSLLIHFLNNLLSLTVSYGYLDGIPPLIAYLTVGVLTLTSILYLYSRKDLWQGRLWKRKDR